MFNLSCFSKIWSHTQVTNMYIRKRVNIVHVCVVVVVVYALCTCTRICVCVCVHTYVCTTYACMYVCTYMRERRDQPC